MQRMGKRVSGGRSAAERLDWTGLEQTGRDGRLSSFFFLSLVCCPVCCPEKDGAFPSLQRDKTPNTLGSGYVLVYRCDGS